MTTIFQLGKFRIIEEADPCYDLDNLKGDCYNPQVNPEFDPEVLRQEELNFERQVEREGVFGYELQQWDPTIGVGWTSLDSCWGFVGLHATHGHDIVGEFIEQILVARREQCI